MDRSLVYAGQVPRALDNLKLGEFAMVGLAQLAAALLGTSTIVSQGGFAVTPGGGLNIAVAPGQIYQLQSIEPTIQSALNVDGHQIFKQGIALDAQTLTLAPPSTAGYAQNFLLQVAYQDVPDGQTLLSFQNPTPVLDPATGALKYVTYPGPGGNGQQSYTILRGGVSVVPKPGTAAPAGSQTTPAPDAGYVGLYVITLVYGATSISAGNISVYASAPFIPVTLPGVPAGVQAGAWTFGQDTGSADNYAVTLSPNSGAPVTNQRVFVKFANANATTSPVFGLNGTAAKALLKRDGSAPAVGDVPTQGWRWIFYDGAAWRLEGSAASDSALNSSTGAGVIVPVNTTSPTLYVRSDGNDANDGSGNTAAKAFATLAAAIAASFKYVTTGLPVVIQIGLAGTYAYPGQINLAGRSLKIVGDPANQGNYVISGAGTALGGLVSGVNGTLTLSGVTLNNTGTGTDSAAVGSGGTLNVDHVTFQATNGSSGCDLGCYGGTLNLGTGLIFASSRRAWLNCGRGYVVFDVTGTYTWSGTPTYATAGVIALALTSINTTNTGSGSPTFTGAASGPRYSNQQNSSIFTAGAGANFFPGSSAGSSDASSVYA